MYANYHLCLNSLVLQDYFWLFLFVFWIIKDAFVTLLLTHTCYGYITMSYDYVLTKWVGKRSGHITAKGHTVYICMLWKTFWVRAILKFITKNKYRYFLVFKCLNDTVSNQGFGKSSLSLLDLSSAWSQIDIPKL